MDHISYIDENSLLNGFSRAENNLMFCVIKEKKIVKPSKMDMF
jgi:hypothetical protein